MRSWSFMLDHLQIRVWWVHALCLGRTCRGTQRGTLEKLVPLSLTLTEIHIYLPQRNSGVREPNIRTIMRCKMRPPPPPPPKKRIWAAGGGFGCQKRGWSRLQTSG